MITKILRTTGVDHGTQTINSLRNITSLCMFSLFWYSAASEFIFFNKKKSMYWNLIFIHSNLSWREKKYKTFKLLKKTVLKIGMKYFFWLFLIILYLPETRLVCLEILTFFFIFLLLSFSILSWNLLNLYAAYILWL